MNLKKISFLLILVFINSQVFSASGIKIKKDWFMIDGERFFVKGIGYSNCRPHQQPDSKKIDLAQTENDFKLIKEAGFNTIRTWTPISLEELQIANQFGLYVIQGSWIEYRENYADPDSLKFTVDALNSMVNESKQVDNVIMYLVGNEPQPSQVVSVGLQETNQFFKTLRDSIKDISKKAPVAMSNWVQSDFLDDSIWDVASVNLYSYNPESVSHAMGYRGYVEWMKRTRAPKKPFVITEYGLSVSKTTVGNKGYGGNTEEEQATGLVTMYKEAIAGGVTGACVFEWMDEWWKNLNHPSDKDIHEPNDPEEWFGICYYDDKGTLHKRAAYEALKKFNQAICITPKDSENVSGNVPVEVYVNDNITAVSVKVNDSDWQSLNSNSKHWFNGKISVENIKDGKATLYIRSTQYKSEEDVINSQNIYVNNKNSFNTPYSVNIILDKDVYYTQNKMSTVRLVFYAHDIKNKPVANCEVKISIFEPVLNQKLVLALKTDENGYAKHIYNINEPGVLTVAAGVIAYPGENIDYVKYGDCKHIKILFDEKK